MKNRKASSSIQLIILLVLLAVFLFLEILWNVYSCSNYGSLTERTTKFSIVNGCFVKTDSGWIPQEEMSNRAYGNSIVEKE